MTALNGHFYDNEVKQIPFSFFPDLELNVNLFNIK